MKIIKNDFSRGVNNNGPGGAPGVIGFHDIRYMVRLLISGCVRHGYLQVEFNLVFAKLIFGVDAETFKNSLNAHKHDIIVIFSG